MSDGKVLSFPRRRQASTLTVEESSSAAESFLSKDALDRSEAEWASVLREPDLMFALLDLLRLETNARPQRAANEVEVLHRRVLACEWPVGLFDEREYILGELALVGAGAYRLLGKLDLAEKWLDRSEAALRHIVNPAPAMANVAYARLAVKYDRRLYEDVLELVPSLRLSFEKLGMRSESHKTTFLEAMTLKEKGDSSRAFERFAMLRGDLSATESPMLLGMVLMELGGQRGSAGVYPEAISLYREALGVMGSSGSPMALAQLKATIGETTRAAGDTVSAIEFFRQAIADYVGLGAAGRAAYLRVVLSESLLALDRAREAEWEILQALPTIEEQGMVPEGFAAVALLHESVNRRKADPNALRELREHLQKQN